MHSVKKTSNGGSQAALRKDNIARVVSALRQLGLSTKKEITIETGLSFAKVNTITMMLNSLGLISETGQKVSSGGRPSAMYQINPDYGWVIGCELSHKQVNIIVINLKGKIISKNSVPFNISEGKKNILTILLNSIKTEINFLQNSKNKLIGIGVAVAGLVDPHNGVCSPFPHLANWGDIALKDIIEKEFGVYCCVENVANAAALAQLNYGVAKGTKYSNILALNVGSGLGLGIIINRKLYKGASGSAGEFGHITMDENGPLCNCGNVGCLETLASTSAVVKKANEMVKKQVISELNNIKSKDDLTFEQICDAALKGDKLAFGLLDEMGRYLGESIVTLINLFNPEMIIIGGSVCCAKDIIFQPIMNVVQKRALEIPRKAVEIVFSNLIGNAGILGAIVPVVEHFLSIMPDYVTD